MEKWAPDGFGRPAIVWPSDTIEWMSTYFPLLPLRDYCIYCYLKNDKLSNSRFTPLSTSMPAINEWMAHSLPVFAVVSIASLESISWRQKVCDSFCWQIVDDLTDSHQSVAPQLRAQSSGLRAHVNSTQNSKPNSNFTTTAVQLLGCAECVDCVPLFAYCPIHSFIDITIMYYWLDFESLFRSLDLYFWSLLHKRVIHFLCDNAFVYNFLLQTYDSFSSRPSNSSSLYAIECRINIIRVLCPI